MAINLTDLLKPIVVGEPVTTRGNLNITVMRTGTGVDVMLAGTSYSFTGTDADAATITTAIKALINAQITE